MSANVKTGIVPATKIRQYNRFSTGDWLYWKCEYKKAREHFQGILKQPGLSELDRARCYKSLAAVELALENDDEAVKNYKDQLEILIKLDSSIDKKEEIAKCLISIGKVFWLKLDYVQAIAYHDRALHSAATASSRRLISTVYKNMANIYTKTMEFDKAECYFRKAIELDQQNFPREHPQFGQIYANMGIMYSLKDDHKQALIYFTQARETWLKSFPATHLYIEKMENTIHDTQSKLVSAQLPGVIPPEETVGAAMANKTPQSTNFAAAAGGLPNISDSTSNQTPVSPPLRGAPKRIKAELTDLQTNIEPGWSIELYDAHDLYRWKLILEGPAGTPYENGRFQFTMSFSSDFPFKPPNMVIITKIFHPNINLAGRICLNLLGDAWQASVRMRTILKEIRKLFENPNFDDFLTPEVAFVFRESRDKFKDKAVEWTKTFACENNSPDASIPSPCSISPELPSTQEKKPVSTSKQMSVPAVKACEEVVWMWKNGTLGPDPWHPFYDVEIAILDEAYLKNGKSVELDCCIVNFDQGFQLNKTDKSIHAVIRILDRAHKVKSREKYNAQQQLIENSDFCSNLSSGETTIINTCLSLDSPVSAVANGIRCEGQMIGKPIEADHIAKEIEQTAKNDNSLLGLQCIHQYTRSSFLSTSLNQLLCKNDWSKVDILGPYLKVLFIHFKEYPIRVDDMFVYRGTNLESKDIYAYQEAKGKGIFRWLSFTSTSKNRDVAEFYDANTLMIINLKKRYPNDGRAVDIAVLSQFPEEEEVLLRAGVEFCVEKVKYNEDKKKHFIDITAYV